MIPSNMLKYSIFIGDQNIWDSLTAKEKEGNVSITKKYKIEDRSYISIGAFDTYLAYKFSETLPLTTK